MKRLFLSLVVFNCFAFSASADDVRRIAVVGHAHVSLEPDRAVVQLTIRQVSKDSADSRRRVTQSVDAVAKQLASIGIDESNLSQSRVLQGRHTKWQKGEQLDLGYYSQLTLKVEVEQLAELASVYDRLSAFSEVKLNHTELKHSKRESIEADLRRQAIVNAKQRAQSMLSALGENLGQVLTITEQQSRMQPPQPLVRHTAMQESAAASAIDFGNIEISTVVDVEFEIQ